MYRFPPRRNILVAGNVLSCTLEILLLERILMEGGGSFVPGWASDLGVAPREKPFPKANKHASPCWAVVHFLIGYQCEHWWWWWWWSFWRAVFVYFPLTDKFWLTIGRVACLLFERLDSIFVETTIFWCDKREINYKYRFWWWNFYRFSLVGNEKLFFFFFF